MQQLHCSFLSIRLSAEPWRRRAQEVAAAMRGPTEALAEARRGYAELVAHFAENPAAAPSDGEFWGATVVAFVVALDAAQRSALRARQVPAHAACTPRTSHRCAFGPGRLSCLPKLHLLSWRCNRTWRLGQLTTSRRVEQRSTIRNVSGVLPFLWLIYPSNKCNQSSNMKPRRAGIVP